MTVKILMYRNICIFGYGNAGKMLYDSIKRADVNINCIFCDNDSTNRARFTRPGICKILKRHFVIAKYVNPTIPFSKDIENQSGGGVAIVHQSTVRKKVYSKLTLNQHLNCCADFFKVGCRYIADFF